MNSHPPALIRRVLLLELAWLLRLPRSARIDYDEALRRLGGLLVLLAALEPEALASLSPPR